MSVKKQYCAYCMKWGEHGTWQHGEKPSSFAAPSGSASGRPHDQQWIQEMCELVKNKMPENYSFVVFGFPTAGADRCYYASNATRDSAIAALKEWLKHAETDYLKHIK